MKTVNEAPKFLQGVISPMLTPVLPDTKLSLDYDGAREWVKWLISRGCVTSVFARSGMGKMYSFTVNETKLLCDDMLKAARGKMGVMIGCGGEWLERKTNPNVKPNPRRYLAQAIELTQYVGSMGADAAVHPMPEAFVPSIGETVPDAIFRYLKTIHDATEIPLVLYQPPSTPPAYRMTSELMQRVLTLPRVVGFKISTHDPALFTPVAEVVRGKGFGLICGDETYFLSGLKQGAVGVIGEGSSVYPEILNSILTAFMAGDMAAAEAAQADVARALALKVQHEKLDGNMLWKQIMILNGVKIQPCDRDEAKPLPQGTVLAVNRDLQALLAPYRREHAVRG